MFTAEKLRKALDIQTFKLDPPKPKTTIQAKKVQLDPKIPSANAKKRPIYYADDTLLIYQSKQVDMQETHLEAAVYVALQWG